MLSFILQQAMFMGSIVRTEIKDRVSSARSGKNMDLLCSICTLSNKISFYFSCIKDGDNGFLFLTFHPHIVQPFIFLVSGLFFQLLSLLLIFKYTCTTDFLSTFLNSLNSVGFLLLNFNRSGLSIQSATYSGFPKLSSNLEHIYCRDLIISSISIISIILICDSTYFNHYYVLQILGSIK